MHGHAVTLSRVDNSESKNYFNFGVSQYITLFCVVNVLFIELMLSKNVLVVWLWS
jgi:hypothetical protein